MPNTLFSIITPTLNSGPKLEETINSVLSQDNLLFEYLIIDGGSTDGTLDTVRKYSEQVILLSSRDLGVYDAMNKGIEMARGEYLYFLGAGDCLRPKILQAVQKLLPQKPPALVYGNVFLKQERREYDGEFDEAKITRRNICHQAIFYHQKIFALLGTYDLKYKFLADHVFNIRCFGDSRIQRLYVPKVIADYEGYGVSKQKDAAFARDKPEIIRRNLGNKRYLLNRLERLFVYYPKAVSQKLGLLIRQARAGRPGSA